MTIESREDKSILPGREASAAVDRQTGGYPAPSRNRAARQQPPLHFILLVLVFALGLLAHQPEAQAVSSSTPDFVAIKERAEHGHADAQLALGTMYYEGQGVARDLRQALKWFRRAADQENQFAQYNLGLMYDSGQGVAQDSKETVFWYTKAALHGNSAAQQNLGVMYANGQGVPQNHLYAYVWSSLAAEQGQASAAKNRANAARYLSHEELIQARELQAKVENRIDPSSVRPHRQVGEAPSPPATPKDSPAPKAKGRQVKGSGTGFIITTNGYLLTCHHVIAGARAIAVKIGPSQYPARLIKDDKGADLALLKIDGTFPALAFAGKGSAKLGQEVFTIGYPDPLLQGVSAKFTKGEISSLAGIRDDPRLYQISVPVQPGNSGGPLLDMSGNVTGVIVAMLDAKTAFALSGSLPQNVNYAIKGSHARALAATLPEVADKLPLPTKEQGFDQMVEGVNESTVMVLTYE